MKNLLTLSLLIATVSVGQAAHNYQSHEVMPAPRCGFFDRLFGACTFNQERIVTPCPPEDLIRKCSTVTNESGERDIRCKLVCITAQNETAKARKESFMANVGAAYQPLNFINVLWSFLSQKTY